MFVFQLLKFIKRNWLLFVLFVVYFIAGASGMLPQSINLLNNSEISIDDTPVLVKEINEIGELITAEFYGETYGDIVEAYEMLLELEEDSIQKNPEIYQEAYPGLLAYSNFKKKYLSTNASAITRIKKSEKEIKSELENLKETETELSELQKKLDAEQEWNKRRDIASKIREKSTIKATQQKKISTATAIIKQSKTKMRENESNFQNQIKKRNLVYIGRGWVKAGFDLTELSDANFEETKDLDKNDLLKIYVGKPQILISDINPWYIKNNKLEIKGFELFQEKKGGIFSSANFSAMEVKAVKRLCKKKLKEKAIAKNLMKNAQESGEFVLNGFFAGIGLENFSLIFELPEQRIEE